MKTWRSNIYYLGHALIVAIKLLKLAALAYVKLRLRTGATNVKKLYKEISNIQTVDNFSRSNCETTVP